MQQNRKACIAYIPHGINEKHFYPIETSSEEVAEFKKQMFGEKEIDFVVLFNSRNIRRKSPGDVILSYRHFCDLIGEVRSKRCALVMHTQSVDQNGTDLRAVREALCDPSYVNVYFSENKLDTVQMNMLYNSCDVNLLISSNEGWGLSLTEAMMVGKMVIANVTGGMQDQMRFERKGKWIDFSSDFPSNHRGTVKKCGEWAVPVFPSNSSLAGSVPTPFIYDDRCQPEDVAQAIQAVFNLTKEERHTRGMKAREWVTSNESGMSSRVMASKMIKAMDHALNVFVPRDRFEIHKITERPKKYITHKLKY